MSPENTLLQPREEEGVKYERTFMASEFLDWLVQEGEATTRKEAEQLCQRLMEHGIIQHGEAWISFCQPLKSYAGNHRLLFLTHGSVSQWYLCLGPT